MAEAVGSKLVPLLEQPPVHPTLVVLQEVEGPSQMAQEVEELQVWLPNARLSSRNLSMAPMLEKRCHWRQNFCCSNLEGFF